MPEHLFLHPVRWSLFPELHNILLPESGYMLCSGWTGFRYRKWWWISDLLLLHSNNQILQHLLHKCFFHLLWLHLNSSGNLLRNHLRSEPHFHLCCTVLCQKQDLNSLPELSYTQPKVYCFWILLLWSLRYLFPVSEQNLWSPVCRPLRCTDLLSVLSGSDSHKFR